MSFTARGQGKSSGSEFPFFLHVVRRKALSSSSKSLGLRGSRSGKVERERVFRGSRMRAPRTRMRPKLAGIIRETGLIFVFRHGIVFASPPSGCYLKPDSIQQMLRKPASFNAFAKHTGELCPGGLYPHILPDASSSLHVFSGFWLDLRSSVRQ